MRAKLEFDLSDPDQITEHLRAVKALDIALCLNEVKEYLRRKIKYDDLSEHDYELYSKIQEELFGIMEEYNVNLNELLK